MYTILWILINKVSNLTPHFFQINIGTWKRVINMVETCRIQLTDRLMLDQYLRLNTYYNLPSSCIVYCVVNIISKWKQSLPLSFILILCDIIDSPECVSMTLTWRLSSLTVLQLPPMFGWRWHRGRPLTPHPMSSRLTGEKAKESFLTCHAFLMRLAKKVVMESLEASAIENKVFDGCGFLIPKFEYFMHKHTKWQIFYESLFWPL